ncbi:phage portal protein [Sphingobium phenoxybenzoativorans]|uniref:Phage portal protein n=1 Tax=Sphingobium phenoxybenzoativorans TaxID=1592790 RepID=A0A975K881_9SPHN|nr:phage portal protein [Sphingobium phenoxybenzoativorans]QUT06287.1 phage portal protein [Sphingobium phenoxybenzoativorans]
MKFFGTKAARASARPALSRGWSGGWTGGGAALGEWPASYEAQVRAAVLGNPVAQRAVRLVCEGVGSAALSATGGAEAEAGEADRARALALVQARSGGQALMETLAMHLLLHGNGYVQILAGADGAPAELFALRPERVSVEPDARGWPMAYRYRVSGSDTRLAAEDAAGRTAVIHLKNAHPLDDHYGLGCTGAAAGAVAIHNAATVWNKALLDNAARPSGALVHEPGADGAAMSAEQFARLKAELEAAFQGAGNAGRPMLLEGGLSWQALSLSPADMDFVGLKAAAAREIALAFGVPPMLMGLPGDNSYANYREANKALWRQTILPLADKILRGIAQGLAPWMPGVALGVDLDRVAALSDERDAQWTRVAAADFLSAEEKRAMLGMGGESGEGLPPNRSG